MQRRQDPRWHRAAVLSAGVLLLACAGEGGDGGGGDGSGVSADVKSAYPRYSLTTEVQYVASQPDGTPSVGVGRVIGDKTIGGQTYSRFAVGDTSDPTNGGIELWGNLVKADAVEVRGGEYQVMAGSTLPVPGYVSATLDEAFVVEIEPPLGEPQAFSVAGSTVLGTRDAAPVPGTLQGTYTLEAKDVSVQAPMGTVNGCNHYTLQTALPMLFGEMPVSADMYYHPQLGVVLAELAEPLTGLGLGYAGSRDVSELPNGRRSVQRLAVLGAGSESRFDLSTYDANQDFDADKNEHAKMLLEVRWADEARAMTSEQPLVGTEFGTVFGYFPSMLVASQLSYFFPEENGLGYTHWIAFVDQAAKNEPQNGIAYRVSASYEPDSSPVRVTARIVYKRWP